MPRIAFLTEARPLTAKVADWLVASRPDFHEMAVVVPTMGAARRLGARLGAPGTGLPFFGTPLSLIDQGLSVPIASRQERLREWCGALARAGDAAADLLPGFALPLSTRNSLRVAESLMEVCSLLAEGGWTPRSEEIGKQLLHDEERWRTIAAIYTAYLKRLARSGRLDPNEARIAAVKETETSTAWRRIIVAGVPDLNGLARQYLSHLESKGAVVIVLVDAPRCDDARFDEWGCPDGEYWSAALLPVSSENIAVAADAYSEAEMAADLCAGRSDGAICLADERLVRTAGNALARRGIAAFDPRGEVLAATEVAVVVERWGNFLTNLLVGDLQILMESPAFLGLLGRETGLDGTEILKAFDRLRGDTLIDYWPDLAACGPTAKEQSDRKLVRGVEKLRKDFALESPRESVRAFLNRVYEGAQFVVGSREERSLRAYAAVLDDLNPALSGEGSPIDWDLLSDAVGQAVIYSPHAENEMELSGWLEAAWLEEECLVIAGCAEDVLPAATTGHPFLPDAARQLFGLATNASRLARDSFLMHNLLASRAAGAVKLICGRQTVEGEPAKPSRLLLRCPEDELVARVRALFRSVSSRQKAPARQREWRLEVPRESPPLVLRVTGFGDYLACPMRFYFKHVLKLKSADTDALEMDAREFGTVFHLVVEAFANEEGVRDSDNPAVIGKFTAGYLDQLIFARHGRRPSLPVRVQQESLRARLRQFAIVQAAERAAGWRIEQAEYAFHADDTLHLGGLPITASLDRIEVNEFSKRRRILDYKTFARDKTPDKVHLGAKSADPLLPGEEVMWDGKMRYWKNLQLPLYRALAAHRWPGEEPPLVGYFLLPERIEDGRVEEFPLDDFTNTAALQCADALAERVRRGIFWPPREVEFDDYESFFLGEDPAEVLSKESMIFLSGDSR